MKMNKKGFTLAELLIVIAIIAILIAIAIPAFSSQLESAKIQADHANMRSAYSIVQTANLLNSTDLDEDGTPEIAENNVYCSDGNFAAAGASNAVVLQASKSNSSCDTAAKCIGHVAGNNIIIKKDATSGLWDIDKKDPTAPASP